MKNINLILTSLLAVCGEVFGNSINQTTQITNRHQRCPETPDKPNERKYEYSIDELLTTQFPSRISNDIDMDPCKGELNIIESWMVVADDKMIKKIFLAHKVFLRRRN